MSFEDFLPLCPAVMSHTKPLVSTLNVQCTNSFPFLPTISFFICVGIRSNGHKKGLKK